MQLKGFLNFCNWKKEELICGQNYVFSLASTYVVIFDRHSDFRESIGYQEVQ